MKAIRNGAMEQGWRNGPSTPILPGDFFVANKTALWKENSDRVIIL